MNYQVSGHPWPVQGFSRPRTAGRVTARDVPPVVFLLSRKVECREAPSHHPGDTRPCVRRRATGSIRAVRRRQSRQRRRIASSATRMRGWVRGWVSTSAGSTRAGRPPVSHVATNIRLSWPDSTNCVSEKPGTVQGRTVPDASASTALQGRSQDRRSGRWRWGSQCR